MPAENGKSTEMKQKSLNQMGQGKKLDVRTRVDRHGLLEHPLVALCLALLALIRVKNQCVDVTSFRSFLASPF